MQASDDACDAPVAGGIAGPSKPVQEHLAQLRAHALVARDCVHLSHGLERVQLDEPPLEEWDRVAAMQRMARLTLAQAEEREWPSLGSAPGVAAQRSGGPGVSTKNRWDALGAK